jgi:hypothetical protein
MPFCVESDHPAVGFGLFIDLTEIMQFGKVLQATMAPGIEWYALAFF